MSINERLFNVLISPHITNKTHDIGKNGSYVVFKVDVNSTKYEIKSAIEKLFEVKISSVTTLNVKGKFRRSGRIKGRTKNWKKAYVKLKKGHNINFVGSE